MALFDEFCTSNGIFHQSTSSYSPQSDGFVERKNCTSKDMTNAMLISTSLRKTCRGKSYSHQIIY